jgi:hypothetical protein
MTAHSIEIRHKPNHTGTLTGATTHVYLDGKLLTACKSFKFEVEAGKIAKATLELYVRDVTLDGITADIEQIEVPVKYVIGQLEAKYIAPGETNEKDNPQT